MLFDVKLEKTFVRESVGARLLEFEIGNPTGNQRLHSKALERVPDIRFLFLFPFVSRLGRLDQAAPVHIGSHQSL